MMQKKWFRIETDASGAILRCDEVEAKGRQGSTVRYYEALTKAEACDAVKEWYATYREKSRKYTAEARAKKRDAGLCEGCGVAPPEGGNIYCHACKARRRESRRRAQIGMARVYTCDPHIVHNARLATTRKQNDRKSARWGTPTAYLNALVIKRFDRLGPDAFRADLCARIVKNGGGKALEEYERKRNEQSLSASASASTYAGNWDKALEEFDAAAE